MENKNQMNNKMLNPYHWVLQENPIIYPFTSCTNLIYAHWILHGGAFGFDLIGGRKQDEKLVVSWQSLHSWQR